MSAEHELQVGRQKIRFDREATVALYRDTITVADADQCICAYCKNFVTYRNRAYPEVFHHLSETIGINPMRMAAGVKSRLWEIGDIVKVVEEWEDALE